jgi:hypothetical protein
MCEYFFLNQLLYEICWHNHNLCIELFESWPCVWNYDDVLTVCFQQTNDSLEKKNCLKCMFLYFSDNMEGM